MCGARPTLQLGAAGALVVEWAALHREELLDNWVLLRARRPPHALASGAVAVHAATGRARRNMPDPIPVMVLGRLAVDKEYQACGLGRALLRDAILRTTQAAAIGGVRAI